METTNIYIIELVGKRYYIGKSDDPESRFNHNLQGNGSMWTRKYKPIKIIKIIRNVSHFEEDKLTKEYMAKHGRDKVRGGSYSNLELDNFQNEVLDMELRGATDKCIRCGRDGHFINTCYARTDIDGNSLDEDEDEDVCYRCGRPGHYANTCYARTSIK